MAPSRRYTGDMEKIYIRDEMIRLGGQIEEARGKQLHPGDTVSFNGVSVQVTRD